MHYFLPFGLGGNVNLTEQKGLVSDSFNDNGDCRAACFCPRLLNIFKNFPKATELFSMHNKCKNYNQY